jgi:hypothetical protein
MTMTYLQVAVTETVPLRSLVGESGCTAMFCVPGHRDSIHCAQIKHNRSILPPAVLGGDSLFLGSITEP